MKRSPDYSATTESESNSIEEATNEDFDNLVSSPSSGRKVREERINKRGLPRSALRLILFNIIRFEGLDDFKIFCNENQELLGEPFSKHRKQVQNKRYHYLGLRKNDPEEFARICSSFELDLVSEEEALKKKKEEDALRKETFFKKKEEEDWKRIRATNKTNIPAIPETPVSEKPKKGEMSYINSIPEYELNLNKPEQNVNRIFAYVTPQFVFEEECIEALVIQMHLNDVRDAAGSDKISASLLNDGSGVLIEEPSVSAFQFSEIKDLYNGFKSSAMCAAMQNAHTYTTAAIKQNSTRRKKSYILRFPDELRCKMGYMNQSNGQKLQMVLNVVHTVMKASETGGAKDASFSHGIVTCAIAIASTEPRVLRLDSDSKEVNELFSRISFGNACHSQVLAPLASPISLPGAASSQPPLSVGVGVARFGAASQQNKTILIEPPSSLLSAGHGGMLRFGSAVADQQTDKNQQLLGQSSAVTPPTSVDGLVSMCRFGSALAKAAPSALGDGSVQLGRVKEVTTEDPSLILASFPVPPTNSLSAEGFTASASTYMHASFPLPPKAAPSALENGLVQFGRVQEVTTEDPSLILASFPVPSASTYLQAAFEFGTTVGEQDADMADVKDKSTSSRVKAVVPNRPSKNKTVRHSKYGSNVTPDQVKSRRKHISKSLRPNDAPAKIEPITVVPEVLQPIDPPTETHQIELPAEIAVDGADVTEALQPIGSPEETLQAESPAEIEVDWVVQLHKADVPEDPTEIEANYLDDVAPHHTDAPVAVLPDEENILPPSELEVGSVPQPSVFQSRRKREFIDLLENDGMQASLRKTYHVEPIKKQNKISHPNLAFEADVLTGRAAGTSPEAVENVQQENDIYMDAIMNAYETQGEQLQLGKTSSAIGHLKNPQADEQDGIEQLADNTSADEVIEPRRSQRVVVKKGKFGRFLG